MVQPHGRPGHSTYRLAQWRLLTSASILLVAAITLLFARSILPRRVSLIALAFSVLGVFALGGLLFPLFNHWVNQAERGGDAERAVGQALAAGETLLLNDDPFDKPLLDQAWKNTFAIRDLIRDVTGNAYKIQPILCFPNAAYIEPPCPVKGVYISRLPFLLRIIQKYSAGPRLSGEEVTHIANLLALKLPLKSLTRAAKVRALLRTIFPRLR